MQRILILHENNKELSHIESLCKKLGFDALGLKTAVSLGEKLLSFNPQIIFVLEDGKKINAAQIIKQYFKKENKPIFIYIIEDELPKTDVQLFIKLPITDESLLKVLKNLPGVNAIELDQKFSKINKNLQQEAQTDIHITGDKTKIPVNLQPKLKKNYKDITRNLEKPKHDGIDRKFVLDQVKDFREAEKNPKIKDIDEARLEFARVLFDDKKK